MLGLARAELPVGRDRHGGAGRADPRLRAPAVRRGVGNFWVDLTRSTLYILLPLSLLLALVLMSQGVVQSFTPYKTVPLLSRPRIETVKDAEGTPCRRGTASR